MNPITKTRYTLTRYIALWTLLAALYAVVFGPLAGLPAWVAVLDGALFGAVSGLEGLILWNVLKYGTTGSPTANVFRIGRVSLTVAAGILFVVVAVGSETLLLWLLSESSSAAGSTLWGFPRTIPARSLTAAAAYVCFVLWYSSAALSDWGGNAHGGYGYAERADSNPPQTDTAVDKQPGVTIPAPPASTPASLERITVRGAGGRIEVIPTESIIYLQAEGDYVAIVTSGGRWLKEGTMKWFEETLPRDRFVRVHRSYIVSVAHISRIETSGRDHTLLMRDTPANARVTSTVRISDPGYRLLKRTLGL